MHRLGMMITRLSVASVVNLVRLQSQASAFVYTTATVTHSVARFVCYTAETCYKNYRKDVFPNINRTQAAEIDLDLQTRLKEGSNTVFCFSFLHHYFLFSSLPQTISWLCQLLGVRKYSVSYRIVSSSS